MPSPSASGQPCAESGPGMLGQLSPLSATPSPSESGQPLEEAGPGRVGQPSSLSGIPSLSVSGHGQPSFSTGPAMVGHLSNLSLILSRSRSLMRFLPIEKFRPAYRLKEVNFPIPKAPPISSVPIKKAPVRLVRPRLVFLYREE